MARERFFRILVALFFVCRSESALSCPTGWDGFGNSCYKFVVRSLQVRGLNWENARRVCLNYGGDLVSVQNKSEMDFIYSKSSKAWREHYWIGLNDRRNESQFVWSDGTPFNRSVYNNWGTGEPNDRGGEDCVELYLTRWNDDSCKKEYGYICERPKGAPMPDLTTVSPPATSAPISCPVGWDFYGSSCYKFSSLRKKYMDAKKDCRASGGYLVKIDDGDEQHFITFKQSKSYRTRWIGLSDAAVEGSYRWEADNSVANYTHWATEEPNDFAGVEDCVAVWAGASAGFWNDDFCDSEKYYICEKPGGQNLCPLNWRSFGDYCYQFSVHGAQFKSWLDAEKACRSYDSTELVSISNAAEQDFVLKQLKDMRASQVWIGLNDRKEEGTYEWTDKSYLTYKNWAPLEPGNGFLGKLTDCAVISGDTQNGTWSMSMCFFRRGYVCKTKNGINQCDSPFGMADENIADSQISASSSLNFSSRASQARLRLESGNLTVGAWCAAQNQVGEYLQIDLGVVRQIKHIALQGRPGSSDYVKTFYLKYGDNGLDFNNYGENATVKYKVLFGNVFNAMSISNIVLTEPINARFIRIYPLSWNSRICIRTEIYGCASQASSKKCGVGWEEGPDDTCYQINSNQRKLWADARATCLSRGGDLVSIVSMKEKSWLNNRLKTMSGWAYSFWLGLNDRDFPKHFYWSDGSPYKLTAWDAGYPKNTPQTPKACVEVDTVRGAWRDVSCGEYRPFICKRKMAITNGAKVPVTGNWISGTDYYWPMDAIVNGKALGTVPAAVHGKVQSSDPTQNGRDVLYFRGYQAYLDAGQFPVQCITDPDQCGNGITVSFVVQFEDGAKNWKTNTFIVDTIGDVMLKGRGFAVYVVNNQLHTVVTTQQKTWDVSQPLQTGTDVWWHVMFTWQLEKGLVLYINGTKSTSLHYGVSTSLYGNSPSLTVGSKSTQPSAGGFRMRSLAVWRRSLTSQEVNRVYLAEFGNCKVGWKDFGQYCYQFNLDKKSWSSARISCVNQQAELASIHSPVEQAHITLETGPYGLDATAWIGLHDQGVESEFQWSDGSAVQFTNWDGWNPDNWRNSEDCANVRNYNDGRWNDQNCYSSLPYICKKPKEYIPFDKVSPTSAPQKLFVCERTSAVLSCPISTVLTIKSAIWGRTDTSRCGQVSVTNCKLNVTAALNAKCRGKNYCSLKATNSLASDPCVGIYKYLEVDYVCSKGDASLPGCQGGWQRSPDGSRCFRVMFDRKNWQDARSACKAYRADLASFHSSTENILVTSLLVNSWDIADIGGLWTGLTDAGQKGVYYWSDRSSLDYTSWLNTQPDERNLVGSCVQATLQPGRMNWMFWQDVNCNRTLPYACAMPPNNKLPPTSILPSGSKQPPTAPPPTVSKYPCPSGWMTNGSFCYKLMPQSKTWTDARDTCRSFSANSNLVSIHSVAENAFVASLFNGSLFAAWIGLSDRGVLFGYVWSDKTPVEFTQWNPQQPDSHQGQQPCVEMYSTGGWGDTGCYSVKQFICKMPRSDNKPSPTPNTPAPTVTQAPDICPPNWILWNTMCYYVANFSSSSRVTWRVARQACQSIRGGDLVSILSTAENNFIKSKISGHSSYSLWIGLNDLGTESSYQWSDGSPVVYRNYGWKEPNDYFGQEDCMEITKPGYWNDHHCSVLRPYICKKTNNSIIPAFTMIPPTPGPTLGRCKDGWVNYDKRCYRIVSDPLLSWQNARDVCRKGLNTSMYGDLVTVNDQYEQAFLTTMLLEKNPNFWIGFNDRHVEGSFFWTDNSPRKYTNWNVNEPSNYGWSKDCVDMTPRGEPGRWGTAQCSQTKGFICETGALPLSPTPSPSSVPPSNTTCPPEYVLLGDDCYLVSYVKLSWKEAREACQGKSGGDLMSVHSSFEQAFVVWNLKNFLGGFWLGLSREANSQEFLWSDHSITLYTKWAAKQPDAPRDQKTCVVANNSVANAGGWSDVDCSERNGFICRIRKGEPHVSPPLLGSCPAGWEKFDKHCYRFQDLDLQPWTVARFRCQNQGGNLVSITSQQEQDFITFHYQRNSAANIWIGLNDRSLERGFTWSDGSPVTYLNWLPGEPNDHTGLENCIEMWPPTRGWNDQACGDRRGYICKQPLECSAALGMSNGAINNRQITASSTLPPYGPSMARLNSNAAWCASNGQPGQYIQVDLLTETRLAKIATKGFILNGKPAFVKTFTLQTSEDGVSFKTYQQNGRDLVFVANRDANSVVTLSIKPTVDTRLIRIVPTSWTGSLCMRMELYGCPFACQTPLGMQSGALKDKSLSASTSDDSHKAANARPSSAVGWCAKASDKQPWFQISFPEKRERKITKITTWGGGKGSGFVKVYRLAFARTVVADNMVWSDYKEGGKTRNFRGNQDAVNPVTHLLAEPIIAQALRVKSLTSSSSGACLRLEVFGCENGCNSALGLRQGIIKDANLSASSYLDQAHAASAGRLNGSTGWCASDSDKERYFVVDLGSVMKVRTVAIQGAKDGKGYIKSYTVSTKYYAGRPWTPFKQNDKPKVFLANVDFSSVVKNSFASGLRGRYFKIVPVSSNIRPCLRLELYGCRADMQPTMTPTNIPPSVSPTPPTDITYTGSVKFSNQTWTDDFKNPSSEAFRTLAEKIEKSITDLYSGDDQASMAFLKVTVTGFRRGSVIAIFKMTFIRDIANDPGANVTNKLAVAVKSGELGGLAVDPSSLSIKKSDALNTGTQPTPAPQTGGKSSGLSTVATIGIIIGTLLFVLILLAVGWLFYRRKKGKLQFEPQEFDNPVYFSSSKQEVHSNGASMDSNGTAKGT